MFPADDTVTLLVIVSVCLFLFWFIFLLGCFEFGVVCQFVVLFISTFLI